MWATQVIQISLVVGFGFSVYRMASHRAAQGDFPLADSPLLILLVLSWWWAGPEPFRHNAPFEVPGISEASGRSDVGRPEALSGPTLKKRLFWTTVSCVSWFLLESRAVAAAHSAMLEPTTRSMTRYAISSWAFLAFLFFWIVGFPIFHSLGEEVRVLTSPKLRLYARGILIVVGSLIGWYGVDRTRQCLHDPVLSGADQFRLLQALLVRAVLVLYVLLLVRRFLPVTMSRLGGAGSETGDRRDAF